MLKSINKHKIDFVWTAFFVLLFALVRFFENELFYDPFLAYFKNDYLYRSYPDYDALKLYFSLIFRYTLNSVISIAMLYVLFKKLNYIKLAGILYALIMVVLLIAFYWAVNYTEYQNYQSLFYIRRFLIQPILVLLFIPAFYYQKRFV